MTNFNEAHFGSHLASVEQITQLNNFYPQFAFTQPIFSVPYGFSGPTSTSQMHTNRNLLTIPLQSSKTGKNLSQYVDSPSTSFNVPDNQTDMDLETDEDVSDIEEDLRVVNPYFEILNSKLPLNKPPNWLSKTLFGGRLNSANFPKGCPKPQCDDGSLLPEVRQLVLNSINSDGTLRNLNESMTMASPGGPQLNKEVKLPENRGYVSANGRAWFRKKPAEVATTTASETQAKPTSRKRFGNQSLVIAGGKRIYTDNSKECIAYAQSSKCVAGNLCIFEHDGKADHQTLRLCRDQMLGTCRNGSDCTKGFHGLSAHQLPVCQYFLRMSCISDNCPYLHIKHQDTLEFCQAFQKGFCLSGLKCPKPHRYHQRVILAKCNQDLATKSSAQNDGSTEPISKNEQQQQTVETSSELPTCFQMSTHEQDETLAGGRQRRSAAAKNKAWSTLMGPGGGKHKGDEIDEEQQDTSIVSKSTPRSAPRKKQKLEPKSKAESVSPPKPIITSDKKPLIPAQAPRLFSQASKAATAENGAKNTAAFGKEQIEDIEKELFKTYMSNEEEGFSDTDDPDESIQDLLDEDDEEYTAKPKRTYTKRGTAPTRSNIKSRGNVKAPTFASRAANFSHRPMQNMMVSRNDGPQLNSRFVVRPPTLKYASSTAAAIYENRPIKTIVLRKNEIYGNGDGPRDSPRVPMTISSMSVASANKQIEEINKKFGARVVAGDSVQKFNGLIDALVSEIKLMAEDRERMIRNHQELTEQMTLSHSTALDIKDSRIRQLENCVSKLQEQMAQVVSNLQVSYSQHESTEKKSEDKEEETNEDEEA
ncbi:hypothetical protein M3Y97_00240500 [Aphelenchoides bicaudatus]|nr:hypothetical protein M3Y97_00240500 [Aphelenchoides bicaudatus]